MNLTPETERTCESCRFSRWHIPTETMLCGRLDDIRRSRSCIDERLSWVPSLCGPRGKFWQDATVHGGPESALSPEARAQSRTNNSPESWAGMGFTL
jgi:hypothetical protein